MIIKKSSWSKPGYRQRGNRTTPPVFREELPQLHSSSVTPGIPRSLLEAAGDFGGENHEKTHAFF